METTNKIIKTFEVKLGKTYYNQSFFNVSKKNSDDFGSHNALIEIQLGDNYKYIIEGYINRTANNNGTPRIMGRKTLTDWIQKNYKLNDILIVNIITNGSIRLNEKK
jgi:hypothetical protein